MPELATLDLCTGCSACFNVCPHNAIQMIADDEGFSFPHVNTEKCIECKLCEISCPILAEQDSWGKLNPAVYAMWNNIDRCVSSSGGAFSSFARLILDQGGVVYGATLDGNFVCSHKEIKSVDELAVLRGSKYMQSDIGDSFKNVKKRLRQNYKVLYCGTPCQIAGLKSFLQKSYDNLLTIDLACHGVPSNIVFQKYLLKLKDKIKVNEFDGFEFRRRDGWGKAPSVSINSNLRPIFGVDALYMCAFDKSALFRKSCYQCKYAQVPRVGDISLADFWGIGRHGVPFKHDVMKGISLVLVNNKYGENAFSMIKDSFWEERTLNEALIENHNLRESSIPHPCRDEIIKDFLDSKMSLLSIEKKFHLMDKSLKGMAKMYASKYGLFDVFKVIYNYYKTK